MSNVFSKSVSSQEPVQIYDALPPVAVSRSILKHTSYFLGATYISRFLCAVRSVINARFLGPELYGFWGSLMFLVSFGFHLHGGVQEMVIKNVPMYRSRGDRNRAERTVQISRSFFMFTLLTASLGLCLKAWFLPPETPVVIRMSWWVAAVVLPLEVLYFFEQTIARSDERFDDVSRSLFWPNLTSLLLTVSLVSAYGLTGLLVVATATPLFGLFYLVLKSRYSFSFIWSWPELKPMLKSGWPVLGMTLVFEALGWIDRLLVLTFVGAAGFGYYAVGVMLSQFCFLFPSVLVSVIEPRMHFDFSARRRVSDVYDHLWVPLKSLALLMPAVLPLIDIFLPVFISVFLPAYRPAIAPARILLWGSFFMGLAVSTKSFTVALGEQRRALLLYAVAMVVNVFMGLFFLKLGLGLVGIALSSVLASLACSLALLVFAFARAGWPRFLIARRIAGIYSPFAAVLLLVFALPKYVTAYFSNSSSVFAFLVEASMAVLCGTFLFAAFWTFLSKRNSEQGRPTKEALPVFHSFTENA